MPESAPPASPPEVGAPTRSARRGVPWRALTWTLLALTALLVLGLWSARSAILTRLVARDLERRGVHCEGLSLEASATLDEVVVAPAFCVVGAGAVASVRWDEPIRASAEGAEVATLVVGTLHIERRPTGSDHRADALGLAGQMLRAPERVGGVLHFAARLAESPSPRIEAARVEVEVEGHEGVELTLLEVVVPARAAETPVEATIGELSLAAVDGPLGVRAAPRMTEVTVRAEPTRGSLEGSMDAGLRLPILGTFSLGQLTGPQRLVLTVEALDTSTPRWNAELR